MAAYSERWYQVEAVNSVFDYFSHNSGNPIIAMPTGTGKSFVLASIIRKVFQAFPNQRVLMLTHVKKLIEQNRNKLLELWPTAPLGVYSAGMNERETTLPIIYAGVKSVKNEILRCIDNQKDRPFNFRHFGHRDLLFIDECHLLSDVDTSEYQFVIAELKKINPKLKVIGLTATPYRMRLGMLTENGIFTDICYNITDVDSFNRLIYDGFMSPLVPKRTNTFIDTSRIKRTADDFNGKELDSISDNDIIVDSIVKESIEIAHDRHHWLAFATSIKNAEHYAAVLQAHGKSATFVHSKLSTKENDYRIEAFANFEFDVLVNADKLTTGFDDPAIDYILQARATMSVPLWVQMAGRGTRPSPETGKRNCLLGDFGENCKRLGPINDPKIPKKPGAGGGDLPVKICPKCNMYNHASARFCGNIPDCKHEFTFESKLTEFAASDEFIKGSAPEIEYWTVRKIIYNLHEKRNREGVLMSPPCMKVSYFCDTKRIDEYVMFEHNGLMLKRAHEWWKLRHASEPPAMTFEALRKISELKTPKMISVHVNKKYPEIVGIHW